MFNISITSCSNTRKDDTPEAKNGVIDLSGIDFNNEKKINLSGEWEFYWKQLYTPLDFENELIANKEFNIVPLDWDKYDGSKHFGYATYRLKIITKKNNDSYGLKLPVIFTSYNIWIDDKKIISNGIVGNSKNSSKPRESHEEIYFNIYKDFFYLTIQVGNYSDIANGICFPITLGSAKQIKKKTERTKMVEGMILGVILIMALYHLGLFLQRRNNKSTLYFSLFCFCLALRVILVGEHYFSDLFPDVNYQFQKKLEFLGGYLGLFTFSLFFHSEFYKEVNKIIITCLKTINLLFSAFVIFLPISIYARSLFSFQIFVVVSALYYLGILSVGIYNNNKKAKIFGFGLLLLFSAFLMEFMHVSFRINGFYFMPVGVCLFIFAQAFMLSISFSDSFKEKEKLAKKLKNSNNILESKVKARTLELEKANNAKTDFFVNIAHETRTPLTLISNYIDQISEKHPTDKKIDIVKFHIKKLTRNMINFLDFESLQKGKILYNHNQIIDISEIVRIQMDFFNEYARISNILINCSIEKNLAIKIDPVAVERIINNLAQNAIKYCKEKTHDFQPEINIELKRINNTIKLNIVDNGIGIESERIPYIFDPYYQICNEKRNTQGIGMGLNIVKKIVDSFDGSIKVSSIPNNGATFSITFNQPIEYDKLVQINQIDNPTIVGRTFFNIKPYIIDDFTVDYIEGRKNIFIIEDNEEMLLYLAENLKNNYNIFYAENGLDALKKLDDYPIIDLILSDIMMDKMNGYDFYEILRKKDDYTYTPFIFITARTVKNEKIQSLKDGALDYINKPFAIDVLKAKIDSIVTNTEAQKSKNMNEFESRILNSLRCEENASLNSNKKILNIVDDKHLSTREKEVLLLLKEGHKNQEICDQLYISLSTVKKHIQNIYKKCNVTNRHDLLQLVG